MSKLRLDPATLERSSVADVFKLPEVKAAADELRARGFELVEVRGRFAARRNGSLVVSSDDAPRLVQLVDGL